MHSTHDRIRKRIHRLGRGSVFTPGDFLDLGTRDAVDKALSRLNDGGDVRRIGQGIYDLPRMSRRVGALSPDPDAVARGLARKWNARVQRSGASAANALGLSTQVPSTAVYLTDGPRRTVHAGRTTVEFKPVSPRRLVGAGTVVGDVLQAFHFLGRTGVDGHTVARLRRRLSDSDQRKVLKASRHFPGWMRLILSDLVGHAA